MQPSKSKSTRYQPKALYLVAALLFCTSAVVGYSLEYDLPWINQAIALLPSHNYVHWRTRDEAWKECQKTHKPVLYFVLGKKESASILLDGQCLGDPTVAELIDSEFIPVKCWIDHKNKNLENDEEYKYYRDKLGMGYGGTPWVAAVPYALHGLKASDINSTASLVELGVENMEDLNSDQAFNRFNNNLGYSCGGYRGGRYSNGQFYGQNSGGICYGYTDKQSFLDFLYNARLWHRLPPTVGRVHWLPLANLDLEGKSAKPKLLALVNDVGATSDSMRLNLFWKNKSVNLINESFEPYLIEFHRQDPAFNSQYRDLRKKYNIKKLPALVVLNSPSKSENGPPVEHGFNNVGFSVDFLKSALESGSWTEKRAHRLMPISDAGYGEVAGEDE